MDWDQAGRDWPGQIVLVGLTRLKKDGSLESQEQFYGQVIRVDREQGIQLDLSGSRAGEIYWLPPDLEAFSVAAPGDYTLRSTNEVVRDPDLLTQWTVQAPLDG